MKPDAEHLVASGQWGDQAARHCANGCRADAPGGYGEDEIGATVG
jgi:hypothetical protein